MPKRRLNPLTVFDIPFEGGAYIPTRGDQWYVDTFNGVAGDTGKSWDSALSTMAAALTKAQTGDTIYFVGKIAEQITIADIPTLNLKFDIRIIGAGSLHHADQPGSGSDLYHYGSSVWQPAATPETTTPLLGVYGRGWKFYNILFDGPSDAACLEFNVNADSGTSEYSASHATVQGCDFRNGLYGIQDKGGNYNMRIKGNTFETFDATSSGAALVFTNVVNAQRRWLIEDNYFQPDCDSVSGTAGNERHIVMSLNGSLIRNNVFGKVKGTGKYIDLTGGTDNVVTGNVLGGLYDTTDYVSGTGDLWYQNVSVVKSGTSPDGRTLDVPGA